MKEHFTNEFVFEFVTQWIDKKILGDIKGPTKPWRFKIGELFKPDGPFYRWPNDEWYLVRIKLGLFNIGFEQDGDEFVLVKSNKKKYDVFVG